MAADVPDGNHRCICYCDSVLHSFGVCVLVSRQWPLEKRMQLPLEVLSERFAKSLTKERVQLHVPSADQWASREIQSNHVVDRMALMS